MIESTNDFEGLSFADGAMTIVKRPRLWRHLYNPFKPSWGEPYEQIAERMLGSIERARTAAAGHEAILVSHQLPIVMVQRTVLGQRLPHAPWNRECDLASVTSLLFEDNQVTDIFYSSPAQEI